MIFAVIVPDPVTGMVSSLQRTQVLIFRQCYLQLYLTDACKYIKKFLVGNLNRDIGTDGRITLKRILGNKV
jgi:hypothetical protein